MSTIHINAAVQSEPSRILPVTHGVVGKLLVGTNNQVLHNVIANHQQAVHLFPFAADRMLTATVVVDDPKEAGSVGATLTRDRITGLAVWSNERTNTSRITTTASLSGDLVPYKNAVSRGGTVTTNAVVSGNLSARFVTEPNLGDVLLTPTLFDSSGIGAVGQTGRVSVSVSDEVFASCQVRGQVRRRRYRALRIESQVQPPNILPL